MPKKKKKRSKRPKNQAVKGVRAFHQKSWESSIQASLSAPIAASGTSGAYRPIEGDAWVSHSLVLPRADIRPVKTDRPEVQWVREHLDELRRNYLNKWLVIQQGEVVAQGDTLIKALSAAEDRNIRSPFLFFVEAD